MKTTKWEKIFAKYVSDEALVSRTYFFKNSMIRIQIT